MCHDPVNALLPKAQASRFPLVNAVSIGFDNIILQDNKPFYQMFNQFARVSLAVPVNISTGTLSSQSKPMDSKYDITNGIF